MSVERQEAIVDAAMRLLADEGPKGLTHRGIDRALSLPLGSTANYYPSRADLLVALVDHLEYLDRQVYAALAAAGPVVDADGLVRALVLFAEAMCRGDLAEATRARMSLVLSGVDVADGHNRLLGSLAMILDSVGVEDAELVAGAVADHLDGFALHQLTLDRPWDPDGLARSLRRLLRRPTR